jgi:hypothetical protein
MLNFRRIYCNICPTAATAPPWELCSDKQLLSYVNPAAAANILDKPFTPAQQKILEIMQQSKPQKPATKEWVKPLWFVTGIGWYIALSLVIPTGIGYWLDRPERLNTHPLFTLVGFGLGTVVAFYGLYRMLRRFYSEQKEKETKEEVSK